MQWFLNILGSLDYNYTFFQLECIATPIPWNVIIDIVGRRGKRNAIRPPFCLSAAQTRASIFQLGFDTGRPIMKQWFLSLPQGRNTANFFLTMKKLLGGWRIFEPHEFFFVNISLVWIFFKSDHESSSGVLLGVNEFFHLIFPCTNIFLVLRPSPSSP